MSCQNPDTAQRQLPTADLHKDTCSCKQPIMQLLGVSSYQGCLTLDHALPNFPTTSLETSPITGNGLAAGVCRHNVTCILPAWLATMISFRPSPFKSACGMQLTAELVHRMLRYADPDGHEMHDKQMSLQAQRKSSRYSV